MAIYKTAEYVGDRCEECGVKVIQRVYIDDEDGYEFWEEDCGCGISIS